MKVIRLLDRLEVNTKYLVSAYWDGPDRFVIQTTSDKHVFWYDKAEKVAEEWSSVSDNSYAIPRPAPHGSPPMDEMPYAKEIDGCATDVLRWAGRYDTLEADHVAFHNACINYSYWLNRRQQELEAAKNAP